MAARDPEPSGKRKKMLSRGSAQPVLSKMYATSKFSSEVGGVEEHNKARKDSYYFCSDLLCFYLAFAKYKKKTR